MKNAGTVLYLISMFVWSIIFFENVVPEGPKPTETITSINSEGNTKKKNSIDIPDVDTNMFTYMDYRAITNTKSLQYQYAQLCKIDKDTGILYYSPDNETKYYAAALGTGIADHIGETFKVTLNNSNEFYIFACDYKSDDVTDESNKGTYIKNYDGKKCLNIIEFVIDGPSTPSKVKRAGTFTALKQFGGLFGDDGNIKSIERGEDLLWITQ